MKIIEIDFDVYKKLTNLRHSEKTSYNDVLRNLLNLTPANKSSHELDNLKIPPWVVKGVVFPQNTEFRLYYRGRYYYAKVSNSNLEYNGKRYSSPSPAAIAITGNSINGWMKWECKYPSTDKWQLINNLRK